MERKNVIRSIIFIFTFSLFSNYSLSQDYYRFYKGGKQYLKPVYYLLEKDFNMITYKDNKAYYFATEIFICEDTIGNCKPSNIGEIEEQRIVKPNELCKLEEKEFLSKSYAVEKELGFKPLHPFCHNKLKIYLIKKDDRMICELKWSYSVY